MNHPLFVLLGYTWRYAKGRRILFLGTNLFFVIANGILLLEPAVLAKMFNTIQQGGAPDVLLRESLKYLLLVFAIPFAFWAFHGIARVWERQTAFHIKFNQKTDLLGQVMALPVNWHRDHHSGENIDKINRATRALADFADHLFQPITIFVRLLGAYIALMILMPLSGGIAFAMSVLSIGSVVLYDRVLTRQYSEIYRLENGVAAAVHDSITNILTLIALRLETLSLQRIRKKMEKIFPVFRKHIVTTEIKWFNVNVFIAFMVFGVLASYVVLTLRGGGVLLIGTLYSLYAYVDRASNAFFDFAWQYGQWIEYGASVRAAENISDDFKNHNPIPVFSLPKGWKHIGIRKLYFTHVDEKRRKHHLENVALDFRRGQKIALVGPSDSGKSTTLSLLRGLRSAAQVEVTVDRKRMPHGLQHLHEAVALLPQEPEIFAETILHNITLGQTVSKETIQKVLRMSRFEPVLKRLRKGLSTHIAEKGVNLSGGEKQRLALARGLLSSRENPILLMDEPTSSVDARNELKIYEAIFDEWPEKTIVSSVHRLHLLRRFDHIYLFDNGRILEEGTLSALLALQGVFEGMWKEYFKSHKEEAEDLEAV